MGGSLRGEHHPDRYAFTRKGEVIFFRHGRVCLSVEASWRRRNPAVQPGAKKARVSTLNEASYSMVDFLLYLAVEFAMSFPAQRWPKIVAGVVGGVTALLMIVGFVYVARLVLH